MSQVSTGAPVKQTTTTTTNNNTQSNLSLSTASLFHHFSLLSNNNKKEHNENMSSGNLRWMGRLDMYRKVPTDLLEGTKRGSILSIMASVVMMTLFLLETNAYFRRTYVFIKIRIL